MAVSIITRIQGYSVHWVMLALALVYLPITLISHPFLLITSPSSFRSAWFESYFRILGPLLATSDLQAGHVEQVLSRAKGTVLELGPGGGDQIYHYKADQVDKIYAAEPNTFLHPALLRNAEKHGLKGKVIPLEAGAEPGSLLPALKKARLLSSTTSGLPEEGVFDSIVAIKCLCSAPQDQLAATVAVVQALLKPGGEFLFFEHVANDSDKVTMSYAWIMNWIWPVMMGNCHLNGKVDKVVLGTGGWEVRNVQTIGEFQGWEVLRYVKGICRKA
ncbi:hypothetical protein EDD37DRAFT_222410 [Exophiala viscosa]|uniref:S-adenosyl-L-methionine-dependent methyltransferase n=1 Tax=Exophiala viscosa TaxID=2486360 RepID=A0AAN6IH86_9EURO|nr:hypothetical protein EDD36DRAFT_2945 [Exophiala viscosa]KAI1626618.1 hypothetical protein EDD37DRAFT_222410 [Exophiala viscosa]